MVTEERRADTRERWQRRYKGYRFNVDAVRTPASLDSTGQYSRERCADPSEEAFSPLTAEEQAECRALAEKYYWRFNNITFSATGLKVISEDQGGYPFEALVIDIAADPEVVARACLAVMRALKRNQPLGTLLTLPATSFPNLPSEVIRLIQDGLYSMFRVEHPSAWYAVKPTEGPVYLVSTKGDVVGDPVASLDELTIVACVVLERS